MGYIFGFQLLRWEHQPTSWCRDIYLEPFDDPCFDWNFGLVLGGWSSKIEVVWVPGFICTSWKDAIFNKAPDYLFPQFLVDPKVPSVFSSPKFFRQIAGKFSVRKRARFSCRPKKKLPPVARFTVFFWECSPPGDSKWPFYIFLSPILEVT